MAEPPEDLGQHVRFEQGAAHRPEPGLRGPPPAGEPRGQARVQEVQLGALRHAPGAVGEPGLQQRDQKAVLQEAEPLPGRGRRHAGVARQIVMVDHLSRPERAQLDEDLEFAAFCDPQQLADVPLDVGLDVRREVQVASGAGVDAVDPGEPGFEHPPEVVVRRQIRRQSLLLVRQPQQVEDRHAPGERFRDALHHPEVLGAGQADGARTEAAGVHELLDRAEQPGRVLDFVEHERRVEPAHEQDGVPVGAFARLEVVEADVRVAAGALVEQRALAGLARAEQQPDGEEPQMLRRRGHHRLERPVDPGERHIRSLLQICRSGMRAASAQGRNGGAVRSGTAG